MARVAIVLNASWNIYNFRLPLLKHIEGLGHEIVAIAPEDEYTDRIPYQFHPLKMKSRSTNPFQHLAVLGRLIRIFRKVKPDVALLYTIQPNVHGNIAARFAGVRTISNIAGLGNLFVDQRFATRVAKVLYRFALQHPDTVFFQNSDDMRFFIEQGLVDANKTERIPGSGVDIQRFSPRPRNRRDDEPFVFLMATRMLWEKGVAEFVEAAHLVKRKHENVVFRLVGPLNSDNPSALSEKNMDELTAEGVVEYAGVSDRMEDVIAQADCVVLPSYYREGLPRILLEAAAMAKPIITTRVPGCSDALTEGRTGLFCRTRSAESLGKAMLHILELDESSRELMGREGRQKAMIDFNQQLVLLSYQLSVEAILHRDA